MTHLTKEAQKLLNLMADQVDFEGFAAPAFRESKKGHDMMTNNEVWGGREGFISYAVEKLAPQLDKVTDQHCTFSMAVKLKRAIKDMKIKDFTN